LHLVAVLVVLEATVVVHEAVHFLNLLVLQLRLPHVISNTSQLTHTTKKYFSLTVTKMIDVKPHTLTHSRTHSYRVVLIPVLFLSQHIFVHTITALGFYLGNLPCSQCSSFDFY